MCLVIPCTQLLKEKQDQEVHSTDRKGENYLNKEVVASTSGQNN